MDSNTSADAPKCAKCHKENSSIDGVNLKLCAKCRTTRYCSRDCQKADWKSHKKTCAANVARSTDTSAPSGGRALPKNLSTAIDKPFHKLEARKWLYDRPEEDVYKLLIDTYRLRMEDNYNLEGEADDDSIYGGAASGAGGFRRFLDLAESRSGLLPAWWSREKAAECKAAGGRGGWSALDKAVEKSDIIEHYGDSLMPMQMRMFGEQVYGRGPGGQSGATMLGMQMAMESGEMGDLKTSTLDMSSILRQL